MRHLLSTIFYSVMVATASGATCATGSSGDRNMPGFTLGVALKKQIEAAFPTYREVGLESDTRATLWIDPADCHVADLDARLAKVEAALGRTVELRAAEQDFRVIFASRYPEVVATRTLRQVFPSLTTRGDKIGENVEVLVVGAVDFQTADNAERLSRAAAIVGRPVELRLR